MELNDITNHLGALPMHKKTVFYTVYIKSFEEENFCGFRGFLLTVNVLPLRVFLEYWRRPLTTQRMVSPHLIDNEQSV